METAPWQGRPEPAPFFQALSCNKHTMNKAGQTAYQVAILAGTNRVADYIKKFSREDVEFLEEQPLFNSRLRVSSMEIQSTSDKKCERNKTEGVGIISEQIRVSDGRSNVRSNQTHSCILPPVHIALYNYNASHEDELSFTIGDRIEVERKPKGGWWEGSLGKNNTGWFPSSYVTDNPIVNSIQVPKKEKETPQGGSDMPQEGSKCILIEGVISLKISQ